MSRQAFKINFSDESSITIFPDKNGESHVESETYVIRLSSTGFSIEATKKGTGFSSSDLAGIQSIKVDSPVQDGSPAESKSCGNGVVVHQGCCICGGEKTCA